MIKPFKPHSIRGLTSPLRTGKLFPAWHHLHTSLGDTRWQGSPINSNQESWQELMEGKINPSSRITVWSVRPQLLSGRAVLQSEVPAMQQAHSIVMLETGVLPALFLLKPTGHSLTAKPIMETVWERQMPFITTYPVHSFPSMDCIFYFHLVLPTLFLLLWHSEPLLSEGPFWAKRPPLDASFCGPLKTTFFCHLPWRKDWVQLIQ